MSLFLEAERLRTILSCFTVFRCVSTRFTATRHTLRHGLGAFQPRGSGLDTGPSSSQHQSPESFK